MNNAQQTESPPQVDSLLVTEADTQVAPRSSIAMRPWADPRGPLARSLDYIWLLALVVMAAASLPAHWVLSAPWQSVILFDTLVAIMWYSGETALMKRAMFEQIGQMRCQTSEIVHQRKLSLMPMLVVEPVKEPSDGRLGIPYSELIYDFGHRARITNEGNGAAINVQIEDYHITPASPLRITFPVIPFLRVKESKTVKPITRLGDDPVSDQFPSAIKTDGGIRVRVRFEDIEGQPYSQTNTISSLGVVSLGPVETVLERTTH
jgi:hypothetical protein